MWGILQLYLITAIGFCGELPNYPQEYNDVVFLYVCNYNVFLMIAVSAAINGIVIPGNRSEFLRGTV